MVCNLGLFEIAEWESCMWLFNTDILAGNAARQWHCWQRCKPGFKVLDGDKIRF